MSVATIAGGRYRVDGVVGGGGMAVVYRAHDGELHREVAVKVLAEHLADDADFRERFLREARIAGGISHPNVVGVFDTGAEDGRPYIVMELVHGETLADLLARRRRLSPAETVELGRQAAAGLAAAHAHGLVHRDVKPRNLLLRPDGVLKVADFGIARAATATQRLTEIGTVLGTAAYLAPEQAAGDDVSAAADVYSLGAVLYECLTGRPPYPADTLVQLVTAQQSGAIVPVRELAPDTPEGIEDVVMRCLARNPAYRPASAAEVERLLGGDAGPLPPPAPVDRGPRLDLPRPSARIAAAGAALLAVAALSAAAVFTFSGSPPSRNAPLPPDRPGQPAQQARELAQWLRDVSR